MILIIADWEFDIDMAHTMEYSAVEAAEHCSCGYCRNFYTAVDMHYPGLRPFLSQFGVDIEAPEEQFPYDYCSRMIYDSSYLVYGKIIRRGQDEFCIDNTTIRVLACEDSSAELSDSPVACFMLEFDVILPWTLDESMKETVSTANEPAFLRKMWDRLLSRTKNDDHAS